jgi:hypothetical protein
VKSNPQPHAVPLRRSTLLALILLSLIVALALLLLIIQPALAQKKLSAAEAKDHNGEIAGSCDAVCSSPRPSQSGTS